jgi:cyclic lactone autoinducer peptide
MKKYRALQGFASFLLVLTSLEISTASFWFLHQPKLPQKK